MESGSTMICLVGDWRSIKVRSLILPTGQRVKLLGPALKSQSIPSPPLLSEESRVDPRKESVDTNRDLDLCCRLPFAVALGEDVAFEPTEVVCVLL